jgi:heme/copper-type cytochrome/quinol oxidase subunit 2
VISALVGGKNVFIPSTIVVSAGKPQSLSVFNTTDVPHGFAIKGLGIETVLQPGAETKIDLPVLEGKRIYAIGCQLHPPHRTATLVVVPGE